MTIVVVLFVLIATCIGWGFLWAPWRASRTGLDSIPILAGAVLYVLWNSHQAVVVSRRGRTLPVLGEDRHGGSMFLFPIFGDRVEDRCDLRVTSFNWEFNVLTRESIPCAVNVDVWWRVTDVTAFLAAAGTSKRLNEENAAVSILGTTEFRLKSLTDSLVRTLIGQASLMQFLTSIKTEYIDTDRVVAEVPANLATLSQSVASSLTSFLSAETVKYGIEVDRVEVPGVRFAAEIEKELMNTWLAHLKPVRAKQEAAAARFDDDRKLDVLEREKEILGRPAVGTREIVKHMPAAKGLTMSDPIVSVLNVAMQLKQSPNDANSPTQVVTGDSPPPQLGQS